MHKASFDASCRTSEHCKQHSADCIHLHTSSHPGWIRMLLCWLEQLSRQQPQTPRLPMFCILTSSRQHICPHVRASLTPLCPYPGATLPTLQLCLTQGCCCAGRFQQLPKRPQGSRPMLHSTSPASTSRLSQGTGATMWLRCTGQAVVSTFDPPSQAIHTSGA